jgi:AcrR family transcriptional regulator
MLPATCRHKKASGRIHREFAIIEGSLLCRTTRQRLRVSNHLVTIVAMARPRTQVLVKRPTRDAERTKAAILAAATREFASYGLAGARVDRIAERAHANKRMLYYYFGDKDSLFGAVLEGAYARIRSAEQKLSLLDLPPEEGIARLVAFTWNYYLRNPEFMTLLNSENLHRANHIKGSRRVRELNSPLIETLRVLLKRGCAAGTFRPRVDPLQLYISIAALSYFYLSNNYTLSAIFARDLASSAAMRARLRHMTDVVLGFLRPTALTHARRPGHN